jgi:heme/copper-type cytochrome/quinol oxidase subunit 3
MKTATTAQHGQQHPIKLDLVWVFIFTLFYLL